MIEYQDLPVTLPSLSIAIVRVPKKMSEFDFTTLVNHINSWKPALVATDAPDNEPIEVAE